MSSFELAYAVTMSHEGGYCNDSDDVGGETYKGVSRHFNPDWEGWDVIDDHKCCESFPVSLGADDGLQAMVRALYKRKYFDPYRGDSYPEKLALEMFDTSVNMGVGRAVTFLQKSLNILNRNEARYADLVEDGAFGNMTFNTLRKFLDRHSRDYNTLLKIMNVLQGAHYIEYMKKSPVQEKYAKGWFNRVDISKG